jgi:phosphoglycolate phosphatase
MVEAFVRHTGLSPQEIALVGDSTHDLHAARKAGAVAIAVLSGPATREDLEPHADHVINSIADLPDLVARI